MVATGAQQHTCTLLGRIVLWLLASLLAPPAAFSQAGPASLTHARGSTGVSEPRPLGGGRPELSQGSTSLLDASFEGKSIASIIFDPPQQPYPLQTLLDRLPVKIGDAFHQRDLPDAIQKLFSTGRFADIAVDGTDLNGGILLKFVTKPRLLCRPGDFYGRKGASQQWAA